MTNLHELRRTLGGVQAAPFEGDNLAIFLVGIFEGEVDSEKLAETGTWKQEAVGMTDAVLDAIHSHYARAVEDLASAVRPCDGNTETQEGPFIRRTRLGYPALGWTCFHCGETFTTPGEARDHFGCDQTDDPACRIKTGDERGLVMALRKAEAEIRRLCSEEQDYQRYIDSVRHLRDDSGDRPPGGPVDAPRSAEWLPIATAPRQCTIDRSLSHDYYAWTTETLWVRDADGRVYEAWFVEVGNYWWDADGEDDCNPVEWMPHPLWKPEA